MGFVPSIVAISPRSAEVLIFPRCLYNQSPQNAYSRGVFAEARVARYYENLGFKLLLRNYRSIGCEIDLLMFDQQDLIVVEVKKRKVFPESASEIKGLLTKAKQRSLKRGVHLLLKTTTLPQWRALRLDLAVVNQQNEIRVYKDVQLDWST